MDIKEITIKLCSACGVSGSEEPATEVAKEYLEKYCEITTAPNGNLFATLGKKNSDKTILLDAHIDRIGLMVTSIDDNGFVKVDKCGGIDVRTLQDTEVVIQNQPQVTGVVCCMPPHLSDGNEDKANPISKTWVDFGLSKDEVSQMLSIGDVLTFKSKPRTMLENKICSPCLDDRCGVAALIRCAQILSECDDLKYKVVILLSVQEETFETGAKTGSFAVDADEAIAVDVSFASQPDVTGQYAGISLGKGPMICISPVLNRAMSDKFVEVAKKYNIPFQFEPIAGVTGTNADSISVAKCGIKSSVISIPQKNMHTPNEVVSVDDIENTAILIAEYIKCGGAFNA